VRKNNIEKCDDQGGVVDGHTMRTKRQYVETQINFDGLIVAAAIGRGWRPSTPWRSVGI
jgi:hypothetical protein